MALERQKVAAEKKSNHQQHQQKQAEGLMPRMKVRMSSCLSAAIPFWPKCLNAGNVRIKKKNADGLHVDMANTSWHRTFKYDHDDKFFTGGQKRNLGNF